MPEHGPVASNGPGLVNNSVHLGGGDHGEFGPQSRTPKGGACNLLVSFQSHVVEESSWVRSMEVASLCGDLPYLMRWKELGEMDGSRTAL